MISVSQHLIISFLTYPISLSTLLTISNSSLIKLDVHSHITHQVGKIHSSSLPNSDVCVVYRSALIISVEHRHTLCSCSFTSAFIIVQHFDGSTHQTFPSSQKGFDALFCKLICIYSFLLIYLSLSRFQTQVKHCIAQLQSATSST